MTALADFVSAYTIPITATGLPKPVVIGPNPYGRRDCPRWRVSMVFNGLTAYCMKKDGTWDKYGEQFGTAQDAYAILMTFGIRGWKARPFVPDSDATPPGHKNRDKK
jgi:hypothetical protein